METTILSEKGQVVIPASVRAHLGLQRGDRFQVEVRSDEVVLRVLPRNPLLALRGVFRGDDLTEELLQERRRDREREDRG